MAPKKIIFISGKNKLVGNLFIPQENHRQTGLLILHGGGESSKERFRQLQEKVYEKGFTSLAFDFQGVGESAGVFEQGTLLQRRKDAQAAYNELKRYVSEIIVVGFSLGGHIAVRLVEVEEICALILFYPGAYAQKAEDKLLNEEFTKVLRTQNSWKDSPAFTTLENYSGNSLIIYGAEDNVIPKEVQFRYKEAIGNKGKFVKITHGTHALLVPQTREQQEAKNQAYVEVDTFLEMLT
jgi:esterase/lipase